MKKILIVFLLFLTLNGCDSSIKSNEELSERISYFKDFNTNLCFGQITSYTYASYKSVAFTCVPCDSVKNLLNIDSLKK